MFNYDEKPQYFTDNSYFKCRKNKERAGIKNKVFRVTISLMPTIIKMYAHIQ